MTKKEADIEAKKIFQEAAMKTEEIIKKAKADGKWQKGLDSNKELFEELEMETKEKIKKLASRIEK